MRAENRTATGYAIRYVTHSSSASIAFWGESQCTQIACIEIGGAGDAIGNSTFITFFFVMLVQYVTIVTAGAGGR